jgi:prepilin peptidase CpaA
MHGGIAWFLIALLAAALAAACVCDWRSRRIPNKLNLAIALLAIPFWWATGVSAWPGVAIQLALCAGVFAIFSLAFRLGAMGGGDVKMLAALALWMPAGSLLRLLVIMSIAGGVLTLAMVIRQHRSKIEGKPEIPYGLAISFAAFWLIGERFLNQFV